MSEFTGWRLWLVRRLPWYDLEADEAKHAHDAELRRRAAHTRDGWARILNEIVADYGRPQPKRKR